MLSRHFKSKWNKEDVFGKNKILWTDLLRIDKGNREYEEVKEMKDLLKVLDDKMADYNDENASKMNLVFFD
jgi:hypothetical protein